MKNTVLIGIQSRSTSSRLPNKCFEVIGNKRLLDHVIDAAESAARCLNTYENEPNFLVSTVLLIPYGDPIKKAFSQAEILEGPEDDVLVRYGLALKKYNADYICRITGDCPLMPPSVISNHISLAVMSGYDYTSNVDPECRLALDGIDCEVISKRMMEWLLCYATEPAEREHVTLKARTSPPSWAKRAFTASFFDHSTLKLSVDTKEDLERVRAEYERVSNKIHQAELVYGRDCIHRF